MSYVQAGSSLLLTTPYGADKLLVRSFSGEEGISGLFKFTLELISEDNTLDFKTIVGKNVTLTIPLTDGKSEYINGIVGRFVQSGQDSRFTTYIADVHPWLWLLTMNKDCRIFQSKSVPDIITQVFSDLGFSDFTNTLTGTYQPRDYCVQYMENSFDFVSRLMEEEGIFYFFQHDSSSHKLVLADSTSVYTDPVGPATIRLAHEHESREELDVITACSLETKVTVGQYRSDDYNFETPATDLLSTASGTDTSRSIYEYPGGFQSKDSGDSRTNLYLTAMEAAQDVLSGTGTCRSFHAGYKFTLAGHSRTDANKAYVLRSVSHKGDQNTTYSNSFEALPATVVCRPVLRTRKPVIAGAQTAVVVGKSGEEIWTDQYGRVKVKFHWDQIGQPDETASCWVRVAQTWAGKQWGAMFLPRIGQEVVVSFLEGDPDRPIVTGCVYNAQQTTPYSLPADQTKSTIKSSSSKGGAGFNEIRFEDKTGSEEIFIQAQKDMTIVILNDQTITISKNRNTTISQNDDVLVVDKGNRTIQVNTGNETHEVKGTRDVTVTGNETHTNKADLTQNVSGNFTLKVSGNISIEASGSVEIKAGTSLINSAGTSLDNKAGTTLTNEAQVSLNNKASASQTVDGGGMLTLKGGLVKIN